MKKVVRSSLRPFFPCERMCQCDLGQLQQQLRALFREWGQPQAMKFDNGQPFSDPQKRFFPAIALWLMGLGIQIIYNRPRIPQDNAKVEKSQDTTERWADIQQCTTLTQLDQQLKHAIRTQREEYPVKRLGNQTRLQAFPNLNPLLNQQKHPYCPALFDIQKVYSFLAQSLWERKVSSKGQLGFWDQRYTLGKQYQSQIVTIKMDALQQQWIVISDKAKIIYRIPKPFSVRQLCHLSDSQRT
jgi:hypothetical protein